MNRGLTFPVDQILTDRVAIQAFLAFSKREFSTENMDFVLAVKKYKAKPTAKKAQAIYDKFVVEGKKMINISTEVREQLRRWIRPELPKIGLDNPPPPKPEDLFNQAEAQVKKLIQNDMMYRFVSSDEGEPVVQAFLERVRDFENAVLEYKRNPSKAAAWKIVNKYLSDKAASPLVPRVFLPGSRDAILQRLPKQFHFRLPPPPQDLFDEAITYVDKMYSEPALKMQIILPDIGGNPAGAAAAADHSSAEQPRAPDPPPDTARQPGSGADQGLNLDGLDGLAAAGAAAGGGESISGPSAPPARPPGSQTQPAPQADFNPERKPDEEKKENRPHEE